MMLATAAMGLTAVAAADAEPVTRDYDVRDLLRPVQSEARTIQTHGALLLEYAHPEYHPSAEIRDAVPRDFDPFSGGGFAFEGRDGDLAQRAEALSGILLGVLRLRDPGRIRVLEDRMEIRATAPPSIQTRIAALLAELRSRRAARIRLECLFVPADVLRASVPGWRERAPVLDDAAFAKLLSDPRTRLATALARNGQTVGAGRGERRRFVSDYELNCTGVIPVLNPVAEVLCSGDRVEVTVWIEGDRIRADLGFRTARLDGAKERFSPDFGELELPRIRECVLWTSAILPVRGAVIAGVFRGGGEATEDAAFIVRGRRTDRAREAVQEPKAFADLPIGFRLPFEHTILEPSLCGVRGDEGGPVFDRLRETVRAERDRLAPDLSLDPDEILFLPDGTGFALPDDPRSCGLVEEILQSEATPRQVCIELRLIAVSRAAYGGRAEWTQEEAETLLAEDWERTASVDAVPLHVVASGLEGQVISLRRANVQSIVANVEACSGGTGSSLIEVRDPIVEDVAGGFGFEVRAAPGPEPGRFRLEVLGLLTETDASRRHKAGTPRFDGSGTSAAPGEAEEGGRPTSRTAASRVAETELVLPSQTVATWKADADVPAGRDAILHVSAREGGDVMILVGSVRGAGS
ncbi:MAG: hypothetical protein JXP34_12610 [Planctomycetes bacterium]|nr:hypothetical protein [Planctomycetota bacterium]